VAIKPANTADFDVIVSAPTPVTVDFTFNTLDPNTSGMQAAVQTNLDQFFREGTVVGQDITRIDYESVIINTIDTATGEKVQSFSLIAPTGDITINPGQIGVLGTVTF